MAIVRLIKSIIDGTMFVFQVQPQARKSAAISAVW